MLKIPLNAPTFGEEEIQSAIDVLRSGQLTMGQLCQKFEEKFAKHIGSKNAIFVNSGSSANLMAFFALVNQDCPRGKFNAAPLRPGAEVIVPAVTWSTTIWPIVQAGCIPVLVDSDPLNLQMRMDQLEPARSEKTAAVCPVHVLGNAVDMQTLNSFAKQNSLWVIEDTCEALGTAFDKKFVGTLGDIGTYSFFFSHHITTVEGGMLVTDNDELAELFRCLRAHGWSRHLKNREAVESRYPDIDPRFLFINTGFNLRPTEINAAFGLHQIDKLKAFNQRRVEIANQLNEAFGPLIRDGVFTPMQITKKTDATWFGYPILCESKPTREKLRRHLESSGIETRPIICGNLERQPAFKKIPHRVVGPLKGADQVMDQGLFWGSHPIMTDAEVEYIVKTVKSCFQ